MCIICEKPRSITTEQTESLNEYLQEALRGIKCLECSCPILEEIPYIDGLEEIHCFHCPEEIFIR